MIQTKLTIGLPGDLYEQEADRVAEQVTRTWLPPIPGEDEKPSLSSTERQIQRTPVNETAASPGAVTPETTAASLIVEDEARELSPGQMRKSEFLDELQHAVCATADAELAAAGRSTKGCPYIEKWMGYYRTRDSRHIERTVRRYAPETVGATTARDYILLISERVRAGVAVWARTGEITGVPEGVSTEMPGAETKTGAEGTPGATGSVQFKGRDGGARNADSPHAIQAQLGSGQAIDAGLKSRMESAFGYDFSRVRVHTDGNAARLSNSLHARAFTIGRDIAFASGEYQPGTLIGDALVAHELAHVVQQGGGRGSVVSRQTEDASYNALEGDADQSAIGAIVALWGGAKGALAKIARKAMPGLKSGLRLQRCGSEVVPMASLEDFQFKVVSGNWKVACFTPRFYGIGWSLDCNFEVGVPVENRLGPVSDSLAQQEAYMSSVLAAQAVLGSVGELPERPPSVIFCNAYQAAMQRALEIAVPGAKVTKFFKYCKPEPVKPSGGRRFRLPQVGI